MKTNKSIKAGLFILLGINVLLLLLFCVLISDYGVTFRSYIITIGEKLLHKDLDDEYWHFFMSNCRFIYYALFSMIIISYFCFDSVRKRIDLFIKAKNTSFYIFPFVTALTAFLFTVEALSITHQVYSLRIIIFLLFILIMWFTLLVIDQKRISNCPSPESCIRFRFDVIAVLSLFLAFYLIYTSLGSGYLNLFPLNMINTGEMHRDSLYHSAIAESYKRSIAASTLLNNESFLKYHTFSHFIIGNISRLVDIPALFGYCFISPIFLIPIYIFSQLIAVSIAKKYFEASSQISYIDIILVILFNVGIFYGGFLSSYGNIKTSFIISESFLLANTLAFLFYALAFYMLVHFQNNTRLLGLYCIFIIPVSIFLTSWAKVSVGFVLTAAIMYYVFRIGLTSYRAWLLNVLYFFTFILYLHIFNSGAGGVSKSIATDHQIGALGNYCIGSLGIWGHFLILLIMPVVFIIFEKSRMKFSFSDLIVGKTVWIELIIVVCFIAFLPGIIMDVSGGAQRYFTQAMEVPAIILLCGHNYIDVDKDSKGNLRILIYVICFLWCIINSFTNRATNPISCYNGKSKMTLSDILLEIREETNGNSQKYTLYLDKDSIPARTFMDGRRAAYVCPAMTGIGVINATYYNGDDYYTFKGDKARDYSLSMTDNDHNLTFDEALEKAKGMGKEKVIHMTKNGYEIVDCK